MKKILIGVTVGVAVIALVVFIYTQMRAVTQRASEITGDLITRYVALIQGGAYEQAYDTCLSESLRKETTQADFVAAQKDHVTQYGPLEGWEDTIYEHEANLFNDESLIGVRAILHYTNRDIFVSYKVDSATKPYRIKEIYGSPGTSSSLSWGIW
jgi:hypothetical protein